MADHGPITRELFAKLPAPRSPQLFVGPKAKQRLKNDEARPEGWTWRDWRGPKLDGPMPTDHPRCCKATALNTGLQCRTPAMRDSDFCRIHQFRVSSKNGYVRLPRRYKIISKTLQQRLEELEEDSASQLELREELNLYRASADDAILMYQTAIEIREAAETKLEAAEQNERDGLLAAKQAADTLVERAASVMRSVLREVRECALDAAKIETMAKGNFTVSSVRSIVTQISRIMYEVCGEDNLEIAEEFDRRLNEKVKISDSVEGTMITPDQDVLEMDSMVPASPDDQAVTA